MRNGQRERPFPANDGLSSVSPHLEDLPLLKDMSDEDLVSAYVAGREPAFRELHDRYANRLGYFILRKTGARDRVSDLLQDVWVRVARHLHRFDTTKKFSTWVYTIAANLCKNELRDRSRSRFISAESLVPPEDRGTRQVEFADSRMAPDRLFQKRHLQRLVEETVHQLPRHQELVFRLRELNGRSYREVAEILGLNLGTVKSRLHRARTAFAENLRSHGNVESDVVDFRS